MAEQSRFVTSTEKASAFVNRMGGVLCTVVFAAMTLVRDAKLMFTQALGITMLLPYLAVPVSMALAAVQLLSTAIAMKPTARRATSPTSSQR